MTEAKHVERPAARVKTPPPDNPTEATKTAPTIDEGWGAIGPVPELGQPASAPYDGKPVLVSAPGDDGEPQVADAVWRTTRQFQNGKWSLLAFWAQHNAGGQRLSFSPTHWRPANIMPAIAAK